MYRLLKFFLFLLPAETAHYFVMNTLKATLPISSLFFSRVNTADSINIAGLEFPNKVDIAAGFDKNAKYLSVLRKMGFGFVEIGTVTPLPQDGNPKPRLFRLKKDEALINRMGFNNHGMELVAERLKNFDKQGLIVGGNLGKNKVTPNEQAADDYEKVFEKLYPHVDYFVVNVSSPNTPGLRELQDKESLGTIFNRLHKKANSLGNLHRPIFLKIAPDLTESQLDDIVNLVKEVNVDGLIASNTTIDRSNLKTDSDKVKAIGNGGLSGKPVFQKSNEVLAYLRKGLPDLPIIGVGGIHSQKDGEAKLEAGADLVQIYTGFIYEGQQLVKALAEI